MSAICGIIEFNETRINIRKLEKIATASTDPICNTVSLFKKDNVGIAYIDEARKNSTSRNTGILVTDDGTVITGVVKLYNRRELLSRLNEKENALPTDLDLLSAIWKRWGLRGIEFLLGDFSLVIWIRTSSTLMLIRDAMGAYGLSYYKKGDSLVFASELSVLVDAVEGGAQLHEKNLARMIAGEKIDAEETLFASIRHCPPAHVLTFRRNSEDRHTVWQLDHSKSIRYANKTDYFEHFSDLLLRSLRHRLSDSLPVSISLSGGLDSMLLCSLLVELMGSDAVKTYSNVFHACAKCDESKRIELFTSSLGLDAQLINADDCWTFSKRSAWPIPYEHPWTNYFVQLQLGISRAAGSSGHVQLVHGDFGDAIGTSITPVALDILLACEPHRMLPYLSSLPNGLQLSKELWNPRIRSLVSRHVKPLIRLLVAEKKRQRHSLGFRSQALLGDDDRNNSVEPSIMSPAKLRRLHLLTDQSWSLGLSLSRRRLFGQFNVDPVYPYMDKDLVEYVYAIPSEIVGVPGNPRRLQRETLENRHAWLSFHSYKKADFGELATQGIIAEERQYVESLAKTCRLVADGWVDGAWMFEALNETTMSSKFQKLCHLLHIEQWYRQVAK
jgi:asparagine synthase (glutamine-hydrolysing)